MKRDLVSQFQKLRQSLTTERDRLAARLRDLEIALGSSAVPQTGPMPAAVEPQPHRPRKGQLTPEGRARIVEAQQRRWARKRAAKR